VRQHSPIVKRLVLALLSSAAVCHATHAAADRGAQIFSDDFERTEIGERWKVSVNAFRIVDGVLRAQQMRKEHGAVGAIEAPMRDGVVEFRFRFEGAASIHAVWDDKGFTGSHAGHLCRVAITPRQIRLGDDREGAMRPEILAMRKDPARKAEMEKLLVGRGAAFPAKIEQGRWYRLQAEIAGEELRVCLDDVPVGSLKSPGIAHPTKTHFHFTVSGKEAFFDDVRVWRTDGRTK
jgi:hypothetical protein